MERERERERSLWRGSESERGSAQMKKMWGSDGRARRASLPAAYLSFVGFFGAKCVCFYRSESLPKTN